MGVTDTLCSLTPNTRLLPQELDLLRPDRPSQWASPPCLDALKINVTYILRDDECTDNGPHAETQWTACYLVQTNVLSSLGN